jgi:uncharacterized membrane protein
VASTRQAPERTTGPGAGASAPRLWPGLLLGIGLGGFLDGIVLHQVLQWHHMLTAEGCCPATTVAGLEDNTVADGLFHLATWVALLVGMTATLRRWQRGRRAPSWRREAGLALAGWGLFNLVEGLVDHQLLGLHHVRDDAGAPLGWDLAFLALGAALLAAGAALARAAPDRS